MRRPRLEYQQHGQQLPGRRREQRRVHAPPAEQQQPANPAAPAASLPGQRPNERRQRRPGAPPAERRHPSLVAPALGGRDGRRRARTRTRTWTRTREGPGGRAALAAPDDVDASFQAGDQAILRVGEEAAVLHQPSWLW